MAKIESAKSYEGRDLETIFFRPMLSGPNAVDLGIKVMYNMPVPTTLQFWKRGGDILQKYSTAGWNGGESASKFQKLIQLAKVKAEVGYAAEDYFNMVFEQIAGRADVNLDDLTGTELEAAETALFRDAIAESIRATMWLGDTERTGVFSTFDGFLKRLLADSGTEDDDVSGFGIDADFVSSQEPDAAESLLKKLWNNASEVLKAFKAQGNLVYLVTSDIYAKYEEELDNVVLESAYLAKQNGRDGLSYRGIPVVDIQVSEYLKQCPDMPQSFALLTDRRNLAMAVNTSDFPGTEIRMWYNPDQMENRQRAVFMAGCDYLLPEMVSMAIGGVSAELTSGNVPASGGSVTVKLTGYTAVSALSIQGLTSDGSAAGDAVSLSGTEDEFTGTLSGSNIASVKLTATLVNGAQIEVPLK
ncbi:MAG TPA: hypothetical protein IAA13_04265 [Candidatus Alistipes merdigallinarum]|nr:hypothetical protein [Candidatus Alistipes merdigallinarum]